MSKTYEGKVHDKKICDLEQCKFPKEIILLQDLGFIGHKPANVIIKMPAKASKLKPLTLIQKENNKAISSQRVKVEHAISGVKRSRIVKDKLRSRKNNSDDLVIEIACGLHNFRVRKRNHIKP